MYADSVFFTRPVGSSVTNISFFRHLVLVFFVLSVTNVLHGFEHLSPTCDVSIPSKIIASVGLT